MKVKVTAERWELRAPFRITRGTFHFAEIVVVEIESGGFRGRGEAAGVDYHGEDTESLIAQIEAFGDRSRNDLDRDSLLSELPPGGARNALDCALWDLESKSAGKSMMGAARPRRLPSPSTISSSVTASLVSTLDRSIEPLTFRRPTSPVKL